MKTEFTCSECGSICADHELNVRLAHGWLCDACTEAYDHSLPTEEETMTYRSLRGAAQDELATMAAETGCDREPEWLISEGCEGCPLYSRCIRQAYLAAKTARAMVARSKKGGDDGGV